MAIIVKPNGQTRTRRIAGSNEGIICAYGDLPAVNANERVTVVCCEGFPYNPGANPPVDQVMGAPISATSWLFNYVSGINASANGNNHWFFVKFIVRHNTTGQMREILSGPSLFYTLISTVTECEHRAGRKAKKKTPKKKSPKTKTPKRTARKGKTR